MVRPIVIVHAGAWNIPDELIEPHLQAVKKAVRMSYNILKNGGSALDAVETAIKILEEDPHVDAGVGSFLNAEGEVELDAIIMDGKTLKAGAVAAVKNIRNPIVLARKVMELTNHILLVGEGANKFARSIGIKEIDPQELVVEREWKRWRELKGRKIDIKVFFEDKGNTVGAVAMDVEGNLAAGTSTGGIPMKMPGRVGDSPLIGCGAYADNEFGAVSTTGHGESIMKVVLAKSIIDLISRGYTAQEAVVMGIRYMEKKVNGRGGAIAIDRLGNIGIYHNTPKMAFAVMSDKLGLIADIQCREDLLSELL